MHWVMSQQAVAQGYLLRKGMRACVTGHLLERSCMVNLSESHTLCQLDTDRTVWRGVFWGWVYAKVAPGSSEENDRAHAAEQGILA